MRMADSLSCRLAVVDASGEGMWMEAVLEQLPRLRHMRPQLLQIMLKTRTRYSAVCNVLTPNLRPMIVQLSEVLSKQLAWHQKR